ncbi:MAG: hypothetical protein CME25_24200 [Gemmatimonadetes bacterium]|nr:hypothetical protein [Gemmatimonadota bacterium]
MIHDLVAKLVSQAKTMESLLVPVDFVGFVGFADLKLWVYDNYADVLIDMIVYLQPNDNLYHKYDKVHPLDDYSKGRPVVFSYILFL